MKAHPAQTNFTGGEISPFMMGRVDTPKYRNGASKIRNMIVKPQGGAFRRCGTRKIRSVRFGATSKAVLVPFEFSDEQAYVLEFGPQYIHFYKDGYPLYETTTQEIESFVVASNGGSMQIQVGSPAPDILELPTWQATTKANNGSGLFRLTFATPHTLRTGQIIYMASATVVPFSINGQYTITRISPYIIDVVGSTWDVAFAVATVDIFTHGLMAGDPIYISGATNYPTLTEQHHVVHSVEDYYRFTLANVPYVNNGSPTGEEGHTIPIEIVTSYTEADLYDLYFAQSADVLYIAHPDYPTMKLTRLDTDGDQNDWHFSEEEFKDGPYLDLNDATPTFNTTNPERGTKFPEVYLELTSYSHTATATVMAGSGWAADGGDAGTESDDAEKYIEYRVGDQWRLARLPAVLAAAGTSATVSILDNVLLFLDSTDKLQKKKGSPQGVAGSSANSPNLYRDPANGSLRGKKLDPNDELQETGGVIASQFSNTFGAEDVGKYVRYHAAASAAGAWGLITGLVRNQTGKQVNVTAVTMASNNATGKFRISAETRTVVVTARNQDTGSTQALFASTDVGRSIRLGFGNRWSWGRITTYTSTSQVTVTLEEDLPRDPHDATNIAGNQAASAPDSGITFDWRLGAWSDTTGYPSCVCFHEQRLCFGRTVVQPQTEWMSRSGDYTNMAPSDLDGVVADDAAITYTVVSGKISPIKWMYSSAVLLIGGLGQEWQARAATSVQEPITPTNISVLPQTDAGSKATVRPRGVGSAVIFVDRRSKKVREMSYSFEIDKHVSRDVSIISEHLLRESPCLQSELQTDPSTIYWLVRTDGVLIAMTYERDHEVIGWHRHDLGGDGIVESIAIIPGVTGPDQIYLAVKRTVDGATLRTVEVIEQDFHGGIDASSAIDDQPFLDSYTEVELATAASTINGLHYLEDETVAVVADGVYLGTQTVVSGAITLGASYSHVIIGYGFTSLLGILPPEAGAILGSAQAKQKRVNKVGVKVYRTTSLKHSTDESGTYVTETMPETFYTGDYRFMLVQGHEYSGEFFIKQDLPEPLNILLVAPELKTSEEQ